MSKFKLIQTGGISGILAGIFGAAVTTIGQNQPPVPIWISIVSLFSSVMALIGIYNYAKIKLEKINETGFILAILGSILINLNIFIEITGIIYAIGLIIIASSSLKINNFPKWPSWMWFASPLIGFTGVFIVRYESLFFTLGSIFFGIGFLGYAIVLLNSDKQSSF